MTRQQSKPLVRSHMRSIVSVALPLVAVSLVLAGCSWVPDWANPINAYDAVFGDDPPPPAAASAEDKQLAGQQSSSTFPNVGSVPDKAPQTSSSAERKQIVKGLVADKQNARYTDSTSGTQVASAPPPPPPTAPATTSSTSVAAATPAAATPAVPKPISVPSIVQGGPQPIAAPQTGAPYPQILLPSTARQRVVASTPPLPAASTTLPRVAQPTTPVTVPSIQPALQQTAIAQPALAPAPALPGQYTTVAQVFSARIAESGATVTSAPAHLGFQLPVQPVNSLPLLAQSAAAGSSLVQPAVATSTTLPSTLPLARSAGLAGISEPIIVRFTHGSARIASRERAKVGAIAKRYRASGGGFIRIVGHASSRTKNLPVDKHKLVNFWISMDRAQAVARELMRQGVAPNAIVLEARSDSEPLFFEAMPAGEAQNRRAEVYLEF